MAFARMAFTLVGSAIFILTGGCASSQEKKIIGDPGLASPKESRLSNVRQLTYEGQNAEAYWSYDGRTLTFQHSGEGAQCDQIFTVNADGTGRRRVSNGKGRTTCSYFSPENDRVIYSSTHAADARCPAEPDKSKGYVWPIYPTFQFYSADRDGKDVKPIEPGAPTAYNAELTGCKDGRVVFTSDRKGDLDLYTGKLDRRGFLIEVKQITNTLGYDGGAFFSQDCTKLVWRASRPKPGKETEEYVSLLRQHLVKPGKLEIFMADADGKNIRQVTKLGAATFAPYFTPDHEKIVFASNFGDPKGRRFDIYMIRTNGTELEQITHSGSFDSFPMFSPDGKYLAFSSNRNGRKPGETNVFVGDWNARAPGPLLTDDDALPANRVFTLIREFSADDMEGRGVGTPGLGRAEEYLQEQYKKIGLVEFASVFDTGARVKGYEMPIEIQVGVSANYKESALRADWKNLTPKTDFAPAAFSAQGEIKGALIDVGYGLFAPEMKIDDYSGKSVKGKVVLIRRGVPHGLKFTPSQEASFGDLKYKTYLAKERGAQAVIFWQPEGDENENLTFSLDDSGDFLSSDAGLPVVIAARRVVLEWLSSTKSVRFSGKMTLQKKNTTASNVLGVLGTKASCRANPPIVIGAHLDHLGLKAEGSLEAYKKGVHHGADDNASGIAALLEVARNLQGTDGCFIFAAFTGEEIGVVGSSKMAEMLRDLKVTPKAMLNMDMVGRLVDGKLFAFGTQTAKEWEKIVTRECGDVALNCVGGGDGYGPSDHMPFYLARIPVLHFFTGPHADYHRVSDTVEKINATGVVQVAELVSKIARSVASSKQPVSYVKVQSSTTMGAIRSRGGQAGGASLGTIPDYSQMAAVPGAPKNAQDPTAVKGVRLSGVRPGSAADEAGVKEGDVITGIISLDQEPGFAADQPRTYPVGNLQEYTYVLQALKPGMRIKIQVQRRDRAMSLDAIVGRKQ